MSEYPDFQQQEVHEYAVDLVICIDGTYSMHYLIDHVKKQAKDFYQLYAAEMYNRTPPRAIRNNGLRVKIIVFRDFADQKTTPLEQSRFYNLQDPSEIRAFQDYVDGITAAGGGDTPENALEAIATAMQTDWEPQGGRYRRQAILLFTDTCTYDLQVPSRVKSPNYPSRMPRNVEELLDLWEGNADQEDVEELAPLYSKKNGRLIIFAPVESGYKGSPSGERTIDWKFFTGWNRTWVVNVRPDGGCDEVDMTQAMNVLVGSY